MYLSWLLLEPTPSLHNKYKIDTAYSQQFIVCLAQPATDKHLLGATQSHNSHMFEWF
jgi:hypothetical protein